MKHLLIYTLISLLIILVAINTYGNEDKEPEDAHISMSLKSIAMHEKSDLDYLNFKTYTVLQIEKNNEDILKIVEEINETERRIEEARERRIKKLKEQNTKLNERLNSYQTDATHWQSFKNNFKTNFMRMGLPFSELFPGSTL